MISHPDTTNPFVASFVNYRCTCRLYPITVGSQTFFDWKGKLFFQLLIGFLGNVYQVQGCLLSHRPLHAACRMLRVLSLPAGEFYTDPEHVAGMQATWERWYITAFQSLQVCSHRPPNLLKILLMDS